MQLRHTWVKNKTGCLTGFRFFCNSYAKLIVMFNWHNKGQVDWELTEGESSVIGAEGVQFQEDGGSQQNQVCEFKTNKNP